MTTTIIDQDDVKATYEGAAPAGAADASGSTWHGHYRIIGEWVVVKNASGLPIAYTSEDAALAGAKLMLDKGHAEIASRRAKPTHSEPIPAPAEPKPAPVKPKRTKRERPKSRTQRWADAAGEAAATLSEIEDALGRFSEAMADLRGVQEEYEEAKDNQPDNLQSSPYVEKLQAVCDLEIENAADAIQSAIDTAREVVDEAEGIDLPLGFGRD